MNATNKHTSSNKPARKRDAQAKSAHKNGTQAKPTRKHGAQAKSARKNGTLAKPTRKNDPQAKSAHKANKKNLPASAKRKGKNTSKLKDATASASSVSSAPSAPSASAVSTVSPTSPKRTPHSPANTPTCPVSRQCGACQYLELPYEKQLEIKQAFVADLFEELADEHTIFEPILGMEDPFYYRNKVISPFVPGKKLKNKNQNQTKKGRHQPTHEILCGMYAQGSHRVIENESCLLENKQAKRIVLAIKKLMMKYGIEPYREDTGTGFMRHVVVRVGHTSNEILVTLVTNEQQFKGAKNFVKELVKECPFITSVVQNINERQTNVILGEKEQRLYGPGFILDTLCGLSFRISSHSFYQVNARQTEVLYQKAITLANLTGHETVLDAYCGTGTIGLVAAKGITPGNHAQQVIGVDSVRSAIIDAKNNAKHNGIENAQFICADAGSYLFELAELSQNGSEDTLDVLFMDPPRQGASERFLEATCALSPSRIVYISCNPKTQQRDVLYLKERGYHIDRIQPVDMFPYTSHVETVVLLERQLRAKDIDERD